MPKNYTPGPWRYTNDGRPGNVETADGTSVAMAQQIGPTGRKDMEREANAVLIAEAPAILDCLDEAIYHLSQRIDVHKDKDDWEMVQRWQGVAMKARGEKYR